MKIKKNEREREERVGGGGLESVIGMRNVEEEEEGEGEEWPGERNAHNAVISVFDLPISLWGYYVGTLYGARRRARACVRVGEGGGWFYFTRIIIPLEDRAPIPPRQGELRALSVNRTRLFMDGFSFNFRQGPRPPLVSLTLVSLPSSPPSFPLAAPRAPLTFRVLVLSW